MRPGVRTDRMACGRDLLENVGVIGGVLADRKERRLHTMVGERREDCRCVVQPRAVVKRQHHFAGLEEVMLLEVLEAEARSASSVDLNGARCAERVRIARARGRCGEPAARARRGSLRHHLRRWRCGSRSWLRGRADCGCTAAGAGAATAVLTGETGLTVGTVCTGEVEAVTNRRRSSRRFCGGDGLRTRSERRKHVLVVRDSESRRHRENTR